MGFTGGIANIAEMQGLMVHKLLSEPDRADALYADVHERVAAYNAKYYPLGRGRTPTDPLVNYGLYTADVADFIGIGRKLSSAWSWNPHKTSLNVRFELLHPNNALKWRMQGEYAVEGAETLACKIAAHNEHWSILMFLLMACVWDKLLGYLCLALLLVQYVVGPVLHASEGTLIGMLPALSAWTALCGVLGMLWRRNQRLVNLSTYSLSVPLFGLKATTMPIAMGSSRPRDSGGGVRCCSHSGRGWRSSSASSTSPRSPGAICSQTASTSRRAQCMGVRRSRISRARAWRLVASTSRPTRSRAMA